MWSKLIYRIEVDAFKKHVEYTNYHTAEVYEARLLSCFKDDPERRWSVCKVFHRNSVESAFIAANIHKKKLAKERD